MLKTQMIHDGITNINSIKVASGPLVMLAHNILTSGEYLRVIFVHYVCFNMVSTCTCICSKN